MTVEFLVKILNLNTWCFALRKNCWTLAVTHNDNDVLMMTMIMMLMMTMMVMLMMAHFKSRVTQIARRDF